VTLHVLILRYAAFAVLATLANLATQRFVLLSGQTTGHFGVAIAAGTIIGLLIKYMFDKRWIFYDAETGAGAHGQKFMLYAGAGLATTAIFWGTETVFWLIWHTEVMRELGAVLGLSIGYVVKYNLDRRFVFTNARLRAPA
jgi:putative flippase GtrA